MLAIGKFVVARYLDPSKGIFGRIEEIVTFKRGDRIVSRRFKVVHHASGDGRWFGEGDLRLATEADAMREANDNA